MVIGRRSAWISLGLATAGAAGAIGATLLAHRGWISPFTGLSLTSSCLILGGFPAILAGFSALFRGASGVARRNAMVGALLGTVLMLVPATLGARASRLPPIHDLTTDLEDPPLFVHALELRAEGARDLSYPQGLADTPRRQAEAYGDLATTTLPAPPAEALQTALETARRLGWQITWEDPASARFEAIDTSSVYRLVDDIAVRVRGAEAGSVVDVRSVSRQGVSDFGRNARRIRSFAEALRAQAPL